VKNRGRVCYIMHAYAKIRQKISRNILLRSLTYGRFSDGRDESTAGVHGDVCYGADSTQDTWKTKIRTITGLVL